MERVGHRREYAGFYYDAPHVDEPNIPCPYFYCPNGVDSHKLELHDGRGQVRTYQRETWYGMRRSADDGLVRAIVWCRWVEEGAEIPASPLGHRYLVNRQEPRE